MKNKKKIFLSFLLVIIFLIVSFFLIRYLPKQSVAQIPENIKYIEIGGQKIKVDLALTEAEQTQGLSGRQSLAPNTGMLFVFDKPDKYLFWMKDMNFPIDMIWLVPSEGGDDSRAKVDYIEKNATPESYPLTFGPGINNGEAQYVLETASGFSDNTNLQIGDSAKFIYQ